MTFRILILGGTTEARLLAEDLSNDGRFDVTVSLAGRTRNPVAHAAPVRTGGFGGVEGLANYLRTNCIDLLVDATHPFAANISANAIKAVAISNATLITLCRPAWQAEPGDRWTMHKDAASAIATLGEKQRNVFVTLGRQELTPLFMAPQHSYLVRSVDPVEPPLDLPDVTYVHDRGPFKVAAEKALLIRYRIDAIVTKNSGGTASHAKLIAARSLGLAVEMIERPPVSDGPVVATVAEAVVALDHWTTSAAKRGE